MLPRRVQGFVSQLAAFRSALSTQLSTPTVFGPANPVTGHSLGTLVPALVRFGGGSAYVCVCFFLGVATRWRLLETRQPKEHRGGKTAVTLLVEDVGD